MERLRQMALRGEMPSRKEALVAAPLDPFKDCVVGKAELEKAQRGNTGGDGTGARAGDSGLVKPGSVEKEKGGIGTAAGVPKVKMTGPKAGGAGGDKEKSDKKKKGAASGGGRKKGKVK